MIACVVTQDQGQNSFEINLLAPDLLTFLSFKTNT